MSGELDPFQELTPDNRGPIVVVVSFNLIAITVNIAVIRAILAFRHRLHFMWDDVAFALAVAFAVTNSVLFYRAVLHGLGRHSTSLSTGDLTLYFKLVYAGQLAGIMAMASAKTSVVMLFKRIAPAVYRYYYFALATTAAWTIFGLFSVAFQCHLPETWLSTPARCPARGALHYAVIISNMVTDAMLAFGTFHTIWELNMEKHARIKVIGLFGSRIIVSLVAIGQIVAVAKALRSVDQPWVTLDQAIWEQIVVHFSVISATIPRTNSFWASLQTGRMGAFVTQDEYELSDSLSRGGGTMGLSSKITGGSKHKSHLQSQDNSPFGLCPPTAAKLSTRVYSNNSDNAHEDFRSDAIMGGQEDDETSQSSLKQRGNHGVWRDIEVTVQVEHQDKEDEFRHVCGSRSAP